MKGKKDEEVEKSHQQGLLKDGPEGGALQDDLNDDSAGKIIPIKESAITTLIM
jgi:hypothetical protein